MAPGDPRVSVRPRKRSREWAHSNAGCARGRSLLKTAAIPVINQAVVVDCPGAARTYRQLGELARLVHPSGALQLVYVIAVGLPIAAEDPRISVGGVECVGAYADPTRAAFPGADSKALPFQ